MKTISLTIDQITQLVDKNNIDGFIGVLESPFFEFRKKPYFPDNEHDAVSREKSRLELLKDFSSIANSGGGYIVIGLVPDVDASQFNQEYVKEVKGIEVEKTNIKGWLDILSTYLVPKFEEGFIKYGVIGTDKKLFWICVSDAKKIGCYPFMIAKDQWVTENEKLLKGELYGLYFRDGSNNRQLFSAEKFQEKMAQALSEKGKQHQAQNSGLEAKIDRLLALQVDGVRIKSIDPDAKKKEVVKNFEGKLDPDSDFFYLTAIPGKEKIIDNFWETDEEALYALLRKPPILRNMGWDLRAWITEYPKPSGDAWEIMNGTRKILFASKTGLVAAAGTIQEFLDWGNNQDGEPYKPLINAFALVEYIDLYFHFLKEFTTRYMQPDTEYTCIIGFKMRTGLKFSLHFTVGFLRETAPTPLAKQEWSFNQIDNSKLANPAALAANIIREIYAGGFGYINGFDGFPRYIKKDGDIWVVEEELYKKQ